MATIARRFDIRHIYAWVCGGCVHARAISRVLRRSRCMIFRLCAEYRARYIFIWPDIRDATRAYLTRDLIFADDHESGVTNPRAISRESYYVSVWKELRRNIFRSRQSEKMYIPRRCRGPTYCARVKAFPWHRRYQILARLSQAGIFRGKVVPPPRGPFANNAGNVCFMFASLIYDALKNRCVEEGIWNHMPYLFRTCTHAVQIFIAIQHGKVPRLYETCPVLRS